MAAGAAGLAALRGLALGLGRPPSSPPGFFSPPSRPPGLLPPSRGEALANGDLAVGDQLPSVRVLAERLLVNHNTVAKAFNELVRDGVIESRHGRGVFVAKKRNIYTKAERTRRLEAALESFVSEALLLDFDNDEIRQALDRKLKD